jgi:hypothetical protein
VSSRSQTVSAIGAGLLLALGSGCSQISWPPVSPSQPAETPYPVDSSHPAAPAFRPAPAKPVPTGRAEELTPPQLVGLSEDEVLGLLGRASARREEPPATVWEYRSPNCALNLFFYMDMETKRFQALAYDVSTTDGAKGDRALSRCLKQIMDRRRD